MSDRIPHVVIVGGGFGGLAAAKALTKAPVRLMLIDRTNHHLFQPLLYQVATAVLAPGQIGAPLREILRKHKNATVIMGEVTGVDKDQQRIFVNSADREGVAVQYDYLILGQGPHQRASGMARMGRCTPRVLGAIQSARECLLTMGLDLCDRTTRLSADRQPPRLSGPAGCHQRIGQSHGFE